MATRKQRSRRAKTFRHEYGFVTYDEEGNEIEVDRAELRAEKEAPAKGKAAKGEVSPSGRARTAAALVAALAPRGSRSGRPGDRRLGAPLQAACRSRSVRHRSALCGCVHPDHLLDRRRRASQRPAQAGERARCRSSSSTSPEPDYSSNCYVVRADAGRCEAAVVDPGGDPRPLLAALAQRGVETAGILVTHTDVDHVAGVAALADGDGRRGLGARGRGRCAPPRRDARRHPVPAARRRARGRRRRHGHGRRASTSRSSTSRGTRSTTSPSAVDGDALLRRPPLRRLGRARRPPGRRLGDAARLGPPPRSTRFGPDTVVYPGHGGRDDARARARDESVPRRAARRRALMAEQVPGAARDARRPAGRAAASGSTPSSRTMEELTRALRLPAHPDARASRTPRSSSARPAPARTSSRRRCTRSPTAATAR